MFVDNEDMRRFYLVDDEAKIEAYEFSEAINRITYILLVNDVGKKDMDFVRSFIDLLYSSLLDKTTAINDVLSFIRHKKIEAETYGDATLNVDEIYDRLLETVKTKTGGNNVKR